MFAIPILLEIQQDVLQIVFPLSVESQRLIVDYISDSSRMVIQVPEPVANKIGY